LRLPRVTLMACMITTSLPLQQTLNRSNVTVPHTTEHLHWEHVFYLLGGNKREAGMLEMLCCATPQNIRASVIFLTYKRETEREVGMLEEVMHTSRDVPYRIFRKCIPYNICYIYSIPYVHQRLIYRSQSKNDCKLIVLYTHTVCCTV
jgi:hypothetical protein